MRWLLLLGLACRSASVPDAGSTPALVAVGPRLLSNQTSYPLSIIGTALKPGMKLRAGPLSLPMFVLDEQHAWSRLPAGLDGGILKVGLEGSSATFNLKLVDDTTFPVLSALAVNGRRAFVASTTEDVVYAVDTASKEVRRIEVGDGPAALAMWD